MESKSYSIGDESFSQHLRDAIFHNVGVSGEQLERILRLVLESVRSGQFTKEETNLDSIPSAPRSSRLRLSLTAQRLLEEEGAGLWSQGNRWMDIVRQGTLFIVCGQWELSEIFDRYHAYRVAEAISDTCNEYQPLVISDGYWERIHQNYPAAPVITVGGPHVNSFSGGLRVRHGLGLFAVGTVEEDRRIGYLWGHDVRSTFKACDQFVNEGHLRTMLRP